MFVLKKQASHRANLFDDMGKKRISRTFVLLIVLFLFSCLDNLFAIIVAAFRAYMMRHLRFVALRASYEARSLELPVCTALVAACLRSFALWYCHLGYTSLRFHFLFFANNSCKAAMRGSGMNRSQPQSP